MNKAERWTEVKVGDAVAKRYAPPAFVFIRQLRNGVGFRHGTIRTADALAVSCYPSRGLHFTGFEFKVSRSDWKRELERPRKSESVQQHCRYWFVAAPKGIVPVEELPETWGLIECEFRGDSTITKIAKAAPQLECEPPSTTFVCSILRNVAETHLPLHAIEPRLEVARREAHEYAEKNANRELTRLREAVDLFEKSSGVKLEGRWLVGDIGRAVKYVRESGVLDIADRLRGLLNSHNAASKRIRDALKDFPEFTESA